jgi:hypothetical protein
MTSASRGRATAPVALALGAALGLQAWGCYQSVRPHPDADADTDADSDSDSDSDADTDSDVDGDADSDADPDVAPDADDDPDEPVDGDAPACVDEVGHDVWPCRQPHCDRPRLRITSLEIEEPPTLALPVMQSIVDGAVDDFSMLWLFDLDLGAGTLSTGVGLPEGWPPSSQAEFCNVGWDFAYPQALREPMEVDGHSVSAHDVGPLEIPLRSTATGDTVLELPLRHVSVLLFMTTDNVLVGWPGSTSDWEYAADWTTDGSVSGFIPVAAAMDVYIDDLGTDLCQLLAGSACDLDAPDAWANPPEAMPSGELGWRFEADVGAGAVTIR